MFAVIDCIYDIISDLAYSEIWQKVTKKLEVFPIIYKNEEEGVIKSGRISLQPSGIFGVKYVREEQIFQIQLEKLKPKITKITVKIIISRLQKNGDLIDVVETSDYENTLLEYITEFRNGKN